MENIMKNYAFYTQENYGAEKFYLEDGQENVIVIAANSGEEAEEKLRKLYDGEEELDNYLPPEEIDKLPYMYAIWDIDKDGNYHYGEAQRRVD